MRNDGVLLALAVGLAAVGCDGLKDNEAQKDRMSSRYQAAMDDYRSGRIDVAMKGFQQTLREEPANSSARFMLACLQDDTQKDLVGAYCGYREFLLLRPESDKADLVRRRLEKCEKEVARALSAKYGFDSGEAFARELEEVRKQLAAAEKRVAAHEKNEETLLGRVNALNVERERLMAIIKGDPDKEQVSASSGAASVAKDAKALLDESEDEGTDRIKMSSDVAALRLEEAAEKVAGPDILAPRAPDDVAKRDARRQAAETQPRPQQPQRPKTYEVQEGDTLYGIAKRFYGSLSAWKRIRDANKGLIHMDGRVRVGDTIVLP